MRGVQVQCNSYKWPAQADPPAKDWNTWRKAIHTLFAPSSNCLTSPLGDWLSSTLEEHFHDWKWWLRREKDQFIMEAAMTNGMDDATLLAINRCRLYLQVNLLSDITSGDGKSLSGPSMRGVRVQCNSYKWPTQVDPPAKDWNTWRKAIHTLFAPSSDCLTSPLGDWLSSTSEEHFHD